MGAMCCEEHQWEEVVDSECNSEKFTEVVCVYCLVLGEMNNETFEVFYPVT